MSASASASASASVSVKASTCKVSYCKCSAHAHHNWQTLRTAGINAAKSDRGDRAPRMVCKKLHLGEISPYVSMRDTREGAAGDDSGICSVPVKASWLLLVLIESIAPMGYTKGKM